MDTIPIDAEARRLWRQFWPELALLVGLGLLGLASGMHDYIDGDLVLIGSVNGYVVVGVLVVAGIWCAAIFVVFRLWKLATGRITEALSIAAGGVTVLAALWLSALVALFALVLADFGEPYHVLDVPGSRTSFVVTTLTHGETSVRIYRGDGTRYVRMSLGAPLFAATSDPHTAFRIGVDATGQPFLAYPRQGGGVARVLLPLD